MDENGNEPSKELENRTRSRDRVIRMLLGTPSALSTGTCFDPVRLPLPAKAVVLIPECKSCIVNSF